MNPPENTITTAGATVATTEKKPWASYYERNKALIRAKALERYYKKIGKEQPKREAPVELPNISVLDAKELVSRLIAILPLLRKDEARERRAEKRQEKKIIVNTEDLKNSLTFN